MIGTTGFRRIAILFCSCAIVITGSRCFAVEHAEQSAQPNRPQHPQLQQRRFSTGSYSVRDIDLVEMSQRLSWLGLEIPVSISGKVSAQMEISVVPGSLRDPKGYQATGSVESKLIVVDGFELHNLQAHITYADGILKLRALQFQTAGEGESGPGAFTGKATIQLVPAGQLTADLALSRVPMARLLEMIPHMSAPAGGRVTGQATVQMSLKQLRDPRAWKAQGTLSVDQFQAFERVLQSATADFRVSQGTLLAENLRGRLSGIPVAGWGRLHLSSPFIYRVELKGQEGRWADLQRLLWKSDTPAIMRADLETTVKALGTLKPARIDLAGRGTLTNVDFGCFRIPTVALTYSIDQSHVRLADIVAELDHGHLQGWAAVPIRDSVAGQLNVRWESVRIEHLITQIGGNPEPIRGRSTGEMHGRIPAGKAGKPWTWRTWGRVSFDSLKYSGWTAKEIGTEFRLQNGRLVLSDLAGQWGKGRLAGNLLMEVTPPFRYETNLRVIDGDLSHFDGFPEAIRPPVTLSGRYSISADATGTLEPLQVRGTGQGKIERMKLDTVAVEGIQFQGSINRDQISIENAAMQLYGGQVKASAALPWKKTIPGEISLQWKGVDVGKLATAWADLPVRLEGPFDGSLKAEIPAGQMADFTRWQVTASLQSPVWRANSVQVGQVQGNIDYQDQVLDYFVRGKLLDGDLQLRGRWLTRSTQTDDQLDYGNLQIRKLHLARLWRIWAKRDTRRKLSGYVNLDMNYRHMGDNGLPHGSGGISLSRVDWDGERLSDQLQGRTIWEGDRLFVEDLTGTFAKGRLRTSLRLDLNTPERSTFSTLLNGATASQMSVFLPPETSVEIDGPLDLKLRGNLSPPLRATGQIAFRHGKLGSVKFGPIRLPVRIRYDPAAGQARLQMRNAQAQVAQGRLTGQLNILLSSRPEIDGDLMFTNLNFRRLLPETGITRLCNGRMSGRLVVSGNNVRSIKDIKANLQVRLREAEAMKFPVLYELRPYLVPGVQKSVTFQEGELRARLSGGIIHITKFSLKNRTLQLFANGTISLAGRLGLTVVTAAGHLGLDRTTAHVGTKGLAAIGTLPVAWLARANEVLSQRAVQLRVNGTLHNPSVRVEPLGVLQEDVLRFFMQ